MPVLDSALSRAIRTVAGATVQGADALPEQAIFYGNHSSHLDFLTLWAALPPRLRERARPVAARDYWGKGMRKRIVEGAFGALLVDRHGSQSRPGPAADAGVSPRPGGQLQVMTDVLDAGQSLIIFPEGTRGSGETIAPFRGGLYRLALHNPAIPVIPVTLANLGRMLPKGEKIPVPHLSAIVFGAPLTVGENEGRDAFLERARAVLTDTLAEHT